MQAKTLSLSFKKNKSQSILFLSNFFVFCLVVIFIEVALSIFVCSYLKYSHQSALKAQSIKESNRVENTLKDIFSETQQVMVYLGTQISLYGKNNPLFIENILIKSSEISSKIKSMHSWSLFDWVNPNNHLVINSQIGIIKTALEKVQDSYIWECPKSPWTLQLSHPTIGSISGMWVIPAGVGIIDENNNYLGMLTVGFNVAELNTKVQQALISNESSFVVLDKDFKIVLQSGDNVIDPKSSYYRDLLLRKNYFKEYSGYLENQISYNDIEYIYYKNMEDYPYTILMGFNKQIYQRELWDLILPRLLELYVLGGFCLMFLYFLRKRIFNLVQLSESAQKNLSQHLHTGMKESISSILTYSNILIRSLIGETKVIVTKDRQLEFIEKIHNEALSLHTMTGNDLNMTSVNIKNLIESSVNVQIKTFLKKNINIKVYLMPSLLPFHGDELRLKQIVTSLLSLALEYSPKGSTVKIFVTNETTVEGQKLLIITIEDNGFYLSREDIIRISEKFSRDAQEENFMANTLDFNSIEKLIKIHNGSFHICNKEKKAKIIKVTLPYSLDKQIEGTEKGGRTKTSNIYWFPKP